MTTLGKRLIQAAEDARTIARGEADPSTYRVHVPADIDVKAIRKGLKPTQAEFANRFGFPLATLRDWEQGRGKPDTSARVLLMVREPQVVERALQAT
ncbi:helix-turn-helix domain-containing protein [Microvirga brassicacearum]|uniref:Transcriptional regulator n=1 Tax=Microvirga brassicacearum TaxID=2580413 RepID=A0A5N3PDP5_9HYPH|nr:transcriptional regulator [Microvirga brassicacearum]KAB0267823.1 transcriptional regulator [Microvirga brassicacearum]